MFQKVFKSRRRSMSLNSLTLHKIHQLSSLVVASTRGLEARGHMFDSFQECSFSVCFRLASRPLGLVRCKNLSKIPREVKWGF